MSDSEPVKLFDGSSMDPKTPLALPEIEMLHKLESGLSFATHESRGKISNETYVHLNDQPYITLPCGHLMPQIGLGTWKSGPGEVKAAVISAIKVGYRHIDCAAIYQNEQEIGAALKEVFEDGVVSREDLFITSKLWNTGWNTHHSPDLVHAAIEKTLKDLGIPQLDLYLVHWPAKQSPDEILATWRAMEKLVERKLCKSIGVSNFSSKKLQVILDSHWIKPSVNQIECHPFFRNQELINFCALHDVHVTAYSPLGSPDSATMMKRDPNATGPLSHPVIVDLATKFNKSPAAICIRWAIERGTSVLPKSVKAERLQNNIDVFSWNLTAEDSRAISNIQQQSRMVAGAFLVEGGAYETLDALWDEEA
jgi:alcohol dehydrogenase (NADP+)